MEFREVLNKKLDKNIIALGTRVGGMLTLDVDKYQSIIITGETGTGKSVMLNQIILQMMSKYKSDELRFILVDTTGVELNDYKDTNYRLLSSFNDLDKAQEILIKVIEEIDRRRKVLIDNDVDSIDEFNRRFDHNIPRLLVAIDDNKSLLDMLDVDKIIKHIIGDLDGLNIMFVLSTNNAYNDFFMNDGNLLSKVLITFDTTSEEDSNMTDIPFSHDLLTGRFIIYKDNDYEEYHNFDFDNSIIKEIVD